MNQNIFREYDIRGVVETDFTSNVVVDIARAFGTYMINLNMHDCTIGFDARLSADYLFSTFSNTLRDLGIDVVSIGQVTTPMLYFAHKNLKTATSVMITGSHNPADMNGFKITVGDEPLFGQKIQDLKNLILNNQLQKRSENKPVGKLTTHDIKPAYTDFLKSNIVPGNKKLKVVIDGGNGTGGEIAAEMFRYFGCEVSELYTNPDGRFPNHHPDPTVPKYMEELMSAVKEQKADLGIGYDGDADRIGVVTDLGELIFGDSLMLLFSREIVARKPGATIVGEVKCSKVMFDEIKKIGGNGIMWKAGHSLIKAKMQETKAELGGEVSGHIFFKDRFFGHDDALYASLRLFEILSKTDKTISGLLSDVPKTIMTPEIRLDCDDDLKFRLVEKVTEWFKANGYNVNDVDGARVIFDDGFGLLRASNTQPAITQRYEAFTAERLEEIKALLQNKVKDIQGRL